MLRVHLARCAHDGVKTKPRKAGRLPSFLGFFSLYLFSLLVSSFRCPPFFFYFLSADDGTDQRHFSEASRTGCSVPRCLRQPWRTDGGPRAPR